MSRPTASGVPPRERGNTRESIESSLAGVSHTCVAVGGWGARARGGGTGNVNNKRVWADWARNDQRTPPGGMGGSEPEPEPEPEPKLKPPALYGQPADHRFTCPDDRIPSAVRLKSAD